MFNLEQRTEEVRFISGSSNFVLQQRETNVFEPYKVIGDFMLGYFRARTDYLEAVNKKFDKVLSV